MVAAYTADGLPAPVTRGDRAALKREGRARTDRLQHIYDLGRARQQAPEGLAPDEQRVYEAGLDEADRAQDAAAAKKTPKKGSPAAAAPGPVAAGHPEPGAAPAAVGSGHTKGEGKGDGNRVWSVPAPAQLTSIGQQGAGALLGLIVYAVAINYLRSGPAGVKAWFNAKFLNKAAGSASQAAVKGSAVASPATTSPSGSNASTEEPL